jgi:hypothetical protein
MLLAVLMALPALAAGEPIATAVGVKPNATGLLSGVTITLKAADDLFEGQKIVTSQNGQVQIVFADDTRMVVGPGSTLVIDKLLMRNNGTASNFAVSALGGTFRFITGKSNKSAYKISTPAGTIGVRGTKFDFSYDELEDQLNVVLYDGEVSVCPSGGSCETVDKKCDVGVAQNSNAQVISSGTGNSISAVSDMPWSDSQSGLQTDFRVTGSTSCGNAPQESNTQQPTADPGPDKSPGKPDPIPDPLPDSTGK